MSTSGEAAASAAQPTGSGKRIVNRLCLSSRAASFHFKRDIREGALRLLADVLNGTLPFLRLRLNDRVLQVHCVAQCFIRVTDTLGSSQWVRLAKFNFVHQFDLAEGLVQLEVLEAQRT